MAYIGKQPLIGNFQVCDAISTVNNQAAYTLQVGGANVSPETVNNMIVSVNGVIQKPTASYTVSGSTITFTSALVTGDVIDFIQILGSVLDLGTPSDNTVTTAKIVDGAVTAAKLASGVGGKVLQVITAIDETSRSTTSATFTDITGLSVTITPSSTSSKIYVICNTTGHSGTTSASSYYTLLRGSTNLATNALANIYSAATDLELPVTMCILDSPNTTSATTYKAQFRRSSASGAAGAQYNNTLGSITAFEIGA